MNTRQPGPAEADVRFRRRLWRTAEWMRQNPRRLMATLALVAAAIWLGRGCIPGVGLNLLPAQVMQKIIAHYQSCIGIDETAIWPGDPRQPGCGQVEVRPLGRGVVPPAEREAGRTVAVCYQVRINNPTWSTQGQTRHELVWHERLVFRVATLRQGEWELELGQEAADEERWARYGCPEAPYSPPED